MRVVAGTDNICKDYTETIGIKNAQVQLQERRHEEQRSCPEGWPRNGGSTR